MDAPAVGGHHGRQERATDKTSTGGFAAVSIKGLEHPAPSGDMEAERERARLDVLRSYDLVAGDDETFDRIVRMAAERLDCAAAYISIVEEDRQWTKAACGGDPFTTRRDASFCARAMLADDVVVVEDPSRDPDWRDLAARPENRAIGFYAAAPLRTLNGYQIGTLCVTDHAPHRFGPDERAALRDYAAITMDALSLRQALRQSDVIQTRLSDSEARQRAILDTAADAIVTIAADGFIQSVNPAAERMFGHAARDMIGRNVSMLMPEPHAADHDGYIARYLREHEARVIGIGREVMARRADGGLFPVDLAVSESRSGEGGAMLFTGILRDLSVRKAVEEQLRETVDLIRLAESATGLGHWRLGLTDGTLYWSDQVYAIHGVTKETFTPTLEGALAFYVPGDREAVAAVLKETAATRQGFRFERTILRPDGARRVVRAHGTAQTDDSGATVALVGTFQDVTESVSIAQELANIRERLERATTYTNIGIWEWDVRRRLLWWSERIAPMFGLGDGPVATRYETFLEAVHPDDRAAVQGAIQAALEACDPYEIEHRVVWPDGTVRWMQERGVVERGDDGSPTRMLGVVHDVTRAKEAELALKESERLLIESIGSISDGFVLLDDDDTLVLWNRRLEEIYPKLKRYLDVGARFVDVVRGGAVDGQYVNAVGRVDDWLGERLSSHGAAKEDYVEPLAGGRWVRVSERRMSNGWRVGIRTDITDIRRAEQEAQAANRAKSEFLSRMSHELRTPLNAILGFAQLLQANLQDPLSDAQNRHVGHILEAGHHLLNLINEILDLAHIESGRLALTFDAVPPAALVRDCLDMARTLAEPRGIDVESRVEEALPDVRADATRLRQVLLNLLSNAVKYNHPDGRVILSVSREGTGVRFSVEDTGPGLTEEAMEHLFEPFNRLGAESLGVEGAGIGLTITRQLVALMDGTLGVRSQPGEGATFWVDMPADAKGEEAR